MRREQTLADRITSSSVWRSVVRHGYPDTQRNQALIIASNVFLHIHPVKIKRYATKVTYTFCLGGLSFFMFLVLVMTGIAPASTTRSPAIRPPRPSRTRSRGSSTAPASPSLPIAVVPTGWKIVVAMSPASRASGEGRGPRRFPAPGFGRLAQQTCPAIPRRRGPGDFPA